MPDTDSLGDLDVNEALIYVRERPETPAADTEAISGLPWGPTLRKVEISDADLDRLRRQIGWIAGRLATTEDVDETFAVDAVTLHVGLTVSGNFVWARRRRQRRSRGHVEAQAERLTTARPAVIGRTLRPLAR